MLNKPHLHPWLLVFAALALLLATLACGKTVPQTPPPAVATPDVSATQPAEAVAGNPALTDLWVDPANGDDARTGASRDQALRTLTEAWNRIPQGAPLTTGYRLQLVAGDYPDSDFPSYWESRYGSADFPIIIQAADAPSSAHLHGFVNVFDSRYLHWLNLTLSTEGDVFHCEQCEHLVIRGVTMDGGNAHQAHETIKINQSRYITIENSDISNAYENAIDLVAVQYGNITNNRLHDADDWCIYLKGGSAYFRIEGNEIYNCGTGGFTAGQGSGFEFLVSPWLHYEAYDLKFVNNVIHDTQGAGMGVNGGYNILLAYNTLYRVGANSHVLEVVFGSRSCDGDQERCAANLSAGGWGTAAVGAEGEPVPNRNVYIYNNLIYNPPGYQSQWQHLAIYGPRTPASSSHIPSPAVTDANLQIRGNVIWNGDSTMPLGLEDASLGCQDANPTCNAAQLRADNAINTVEPQLVDPAGGDFHAVAGGNLSSITTYPIPDFGWDDSPAPPTIPAGNPDNRVPLDREGQPRQLPGIPGAYTGR